MWCHSQVHRGTTWLQSIDNIHLWNSSSTCMYRVLIRRSYDATDPVLKRVSCFIINLKKHKKIIISKQNKQTNNAMWIYVMQCEYMYKYYIHTSDVSRRTPPLLASLLISALVIPSKVNWNILLAFTCVLLYLFFIM